MSDLAKLGLNIERDGFLRMLLGQLAETLQNVVGLDEAEGYVSVVGTAIGHELDKTYRSALSVDQLSRKQVAEVLVDLKQRIKGDFYVVEESEDRIILASRSCPFGEFVPGRPALCMMTSNVFGHIASQSLGYARVEINESIARGNPGCRVTMFLTPGENQSSKGREYFRRAQVL
jgi:predicted ArsR family transcriptional regulator